MRIPTLTALGVAALLSAPAAADDWITLDNKPCNVWCQKWMGVYKEPEAAPAPAATPAPTPPVTVASRPRWNRFWRHPRHFAPRVAARVVAPAHIAAAPPRPAPAAPAATPTPTPAPQLAREASPPLAAAPPHETQIAPAAPPAAAPPPAPVLSSETVPPLAAADLQSLANAFAAAEAARRAAPPPSAEAPVARVDVVSQTASARPGWLAALGLWLGAALAFVVLRWRHAARNARRFPLQLDMPTLRLGHAAPALSPSPRAHVGYWREAAQRLAESGAEGL